MKIIVYLLKKKWSFYYYLINAFLSYEYIDIVKKIIILF
jgi:hypothetical protein